MNRSFNETPVELLKWILLIAFIIFVGQIRVEEEDNCVAIRHKTTNLKMADSACHYLHENIAEKQTSILVFVIQTILN